MNVLLVENDPWQSVAIAEALRIRVPVAVDLCETESQFYQMLPRLRATPPSLVILDGAHNAFHTSKIMRLGNSRNSGAKFCHR